MRKSEVREMPSLPRGGGDELVRDEQVSSRRVRPCSGGGGDFLMFIQDGGARPGLKARLPLQVERKPLTVCACAHACLFPSQKQLEDYLNKLLRMAMYRKYHHTVSNRMTSAS